MQRLIALTILILFCNLAAANQLQKIKTQIEDLRTLLAHDQNQQTSLQRELKTLELNVGTTSIQLQKTQHNLHQQQVELKKLDKQQGQYIQQLQAQKNTLAEQLRVIYIYGQQQYLKLLLNQQDPTRVSRILTYYHYISEKRIALIEQFNKTLTKLNQTEEAINEQTKILQSLQHQQQQEQQQLETVRQQRQKLLIKLNTEIVNGNQQLNVLVANKQALEQLVNHLANKRHTFIATAIFSHRNGKFPWPTPGKIIQGFGASIQQSQLKTSGVLIRAPEGQNVKAIAPGQVVFANWLAGYGLLVIVDHNNGFMSIYGRNHNLYKKAGDKVKAGELLASVGDSGGYSEPALYFALRREGKAINPEQWCG